MSEENLPMLETRAELNARINRLCLTQWLPGLDVGSVGEVEREIAELEVRLEALPIEE